MFVDDLQVDVDQHYRIGEGNYALLNTEQKSVVDDVLRAIERQQRQCFFVDGSGGSEDAKTLREVDAIIWDEAPIALKQALEAVNSLLQDIMQKNEPFGGKILLLGGDFRQVLPVVEKGNCRDFVEAQSVTSQPFSPPAFVAPPPPLSSEPPLQNSQFTAQVSAVFASVPENTTPGFDPFANFDAKFSELAFKSSSTVGEFGSPLPAQSLPKSATAKASFQAQTANDVLSVNSLKSEISKISPLNTAAQAEHTPATVHAGNGGDKYSALAELDQAS
ncbi:unnamed protein product [Heligmosomoides polygyrus]|uniref:ATP-dependent DNA helicase n=1 Tax=Heligmosomoides polygyrus TaxID=6339 RepID=A0A183GEI6_HELPZ|nr:unnamed protein product [Heligmosomoides polygyrus]